MDEKLQNMVDEDIIYCREYWETYSYDKEKMEKLFHKILNRYLDKIQNFSKGMKVISSYEDNAALAQTYRMNTETLIRRLEVFRENGYSNNGLKEYYINADIKESGKGSLLDFSEARIAIGMTESISAREKEEIMSKIDEMESICAMVETKNIRWKLLRPYVIWVSGKEVTIAMKILPLFLKIN